MDGKLDIEQRESGANTVISSLLNTAGGMTGISEVLQQSQFESLLVRVQLNDDSLNEIDLLSRILGIEPLISEQEHGKKF
ncbi:hypothetical protein [Moritella viscosa]|uniref:Uncharacterized protein n=1 Tax=Moritella viscosa TaxID=80854 RepID=A0A090INW5_9GAMM|nr:hypothetical protein [Moritella viscosa]CED62224.1 putative uncharacterized protein [Moritella viscosa]SGY92952.1 Putative uncharacterized protein [Moritella viscosa]SGY97637.1 Putative uncharacterized protein [Moritella viscosa]SGY98027.1 Putative uncharacterized protein [Moritella viscosa]SGZ03708.1 Putative uncharacterized protein [Moritella viscosa]